MPLSPSVLKIFESENRDVSRVALEESFFLFCRVFFEVLEDKPMCIGPHHRVVISILERVTRGELPRLIINIPPGYSKTLLVSVLWPAWCMSRGKCRFLPVSYSKNLVRRNSVALKKIVFSKEYQSLWPIPEHSTVRSKAHWMTRRGDEVYCASSRGEVTGFRAGFLDATCFTGAMIIDDALKPENAFSDLKRGEVNRNFDFTLRSRLAHEGVPIVIIMQRLHQDDLVGFLLNGESVDHWHILKMSVLINNARIDLGTNNYTYLSHGLPDGPLWLVKHNADDIARLKLNRLVYASQYDQDPVSIDSSLIKEEWFGRYQSANESLNEIHLWDGSVVNAKRKIVAVDTALTRKTSSDYSAFVCGARDDAGRIYILDVKRGRWESPELKSEYLAFCDKHSHKLSPIHERWTELQAAGYDLSQNINRTHPKHRLAGIKRVKDKFTRVSGVLPVLEEGLVFLPENAPWLSEFLKELTAFNANFTHAHDDMVDAFVDVVEKLQGSGANPPNYLQRFMVK